MQHSPPAHSPHGGRRNSTATRFGDARRPSLPTGGAHPNGLMMLSSHVRSMAVGLQLADSDKLKPGLADAGGRLAAALRASFMRTFGALNANKHGSNKAWLLLTTISSIQVGAREWVGRGPWAPRLRRPATATGRVGTLYPLPPFPADAGVPPVPLGHLWMAHRWYRASDQPRRVRPGADSVGLTAGRG